MSYITLDTEKLVHNYKFLDTVFTAHTIEWAVVAKLLCGNELFLKSLLEITNKDICDSRLSNLKKIKQLSPETKTLYIKPPAKRLAESIVKYADVSFNSELETIRALSEEAFKQQKTHRIVIMVEMGELREGVMTDALQELYGEVIKLPNIQVAGIGTNLNCLNGILPDKDKLSELVRHKEAAEARYKKLIPNITAGSSVTIPLLFNGDVPSGINHFRIGETLFFGTDVFHDQNIAGMQQDVFKLTAEVIEIIEKPMIPNGEAGTNLTGDRPVHDQNNRNKTSVRAIVDVGLLDIDPKQIFPLEEGLEIIGASSDMMILNSTEENSALKVGDTVDFGMNYMAVLRAMNSDYVDKKVTYAKSRKNGNHRSNVHTVS
ncbi:alanine/ornithine racemase family PLP-dependent enzyme [Chryseobacterium sp. SSA4.19]|uniref:alanine racemase n=1 Tax=Chryseobacterium sp. SSA4.19 TaxID=2919915 RepID=UPI001F4E9659|nr:alanine/ornithine racemase family PLP-dependent enzyme [Chryseobacterium sp. SSA4.19]MCJ8152776.1 alanine/ornithine racemase family PLP-dependent enzyme [Chryseobacterium sp. SSA4.19]